MLQYLIMGGGALVLFFLIWGFVKNFFMALVYFFILLALGGAYILFRYLGYF